MEVPRRSWIHPLLYLAPSNIHGDGIHTRGIIRPLEVVIRWGGVLFTHEQVLTGAARQHTLVGISKDLYLGNPADEPPGLDDRMNHSCEPNVGMRDAMTLVAIREIHPGEELTADYAMWLNDSDYVMNRACDCGSLGCRKKITGRDFLDPDVQEKIGKWLSPFLKNK